MEVDKCFGLLQERSLTPRGAVREAGVKDKMESEEKGRRWYGYSNPRKTYLHPLIACHGGNN